MKPRRHHMTREEWADYGRRVHECYERIMTIARHRSWLDQLHKVEDTTKQYD